MNAYRNTESTFLSGRYIRHRRIGEFDLESLGGIDIHKMVLNEKYDLTNNLEFIQPDDGNVQDSTVIRIPLPESIHPGEEIRLNIN